ncbi:hypothetical protein K491DRAFT_379205 [Lophiostoma macrostomum CBS 122681]|uniref:Uncharacterized protein n=1 Tax=Lophiostoma macrostomum CBS 122681 TaxID=1314788 RepID=A0A6A6TCW7_9PLEO|nr:hypothetical protein K491DRAFT_379205 [Lophiostoma macrostomum CBS 122681]
MLKFSYGVLKERTLEEAGTVKTLKYFVELYVVADKYDVPELRKYATQEYIGNVHVYVEQIMPDCGGDQEFATLVRKIYDFECHKSENNRQFCKELVVAFSYQKFNSSAIGICLGPVLCDCIALTPEFARDILLHARQDTKGQHMLQAQPRVIVCSQCHFGWEAEYDFKISDFCPNCAQGHGVR